MLKELRTLGVGLASLAFKFTSVHGVNAVIRLCNTLATNGVRHPSLQSLAVFLEKKRGFGRTVSVTRFANSYLVAFFDCYTLLTLGDSLQDL